MVTIYCRGGAVRRKLEHGVLTRTSEFVQPGAQRIDSTAVVDCMETVAFRNADDGSLVLRVCNSGAAERRVSVRQRAQTFAFTLPRESLATFVWHP